MSSDDDKTCLVCGQRGGLSTRALPYMCRSCFSRLTQAQRLELQSIRKKGLPGTIVALVCLIPALVLFIVNFSTTNFISHFEYSIIGLLLVLVGNGINLGIASSLKPQYRAFAQKVAREGVSGPETGEVRVTPANELSPAGAPLSGGKTCPDCHAPVKANAVFCMNCGKKMSEFDIA